MRVHPLRLAVIGAGPSGFYASSRILSKLPNARVDMYESLPVPYGLVRYGVAPDHPEVKNCQRKFEEVGRLERFTYIGNTPVGTPWPPRPDPSLPLTTLAPHYDALLLAYGASCDRRLSVSGEDLHGVYSARGFVGWYNGFPGYRHLSPRLSGEAAIIIGHGNVALDVARILLSDVDTLRKTDITEHALEALSRSQIKRVSIVGRRGLCQMSFTPGELREMMSLPGTGFIPINAQFPEDLSTLSRQQKRLLEIVQKGPDSSALSARHWQLRFLLSPTAFIPDHDHANTLGCVQFEQMRLKGSQLSLTSQSVRTGLLSVELADIAFRSVGYLSKALPGLDKLGIPFDQAQGLIPNEGGRVVMTPSPPETKPIIVPGAYTSGWVKRGPAGVITSTMYDAFETADAIISDWASGSKMLAKSKSAKEKLGWEAVRAEASRRGIRSINWSEWQIIDKEERRRGQLLGKEREKFTSTEEMLAVLS